MDPWTEAGPRLLPTLLTLGVWLAATYSAVKHWRHTVDNAASAALLAGIVVWLVLPMDVVLISWPHEAGVTGFGASVGGAFAVLGGFLALCTIVFQVVVAIRLADAHPYPMLYRRTERGRGLMLAAVIGGALGAISVWAFARIGVQPGPGFEQWREFMAHPTRGAYARPAVALTVLSAAISEEVTFRGIIQPWLARRLGMLGRGAPLVAIIATSMLWATTHVDNTTMPTVKLAQVTVLGVVFGTLSRKFSVEASIVGHLAVNAVAVAGGVMRFL